MSPWIASRRFDLAFIIAPAFVVTALVVIFRQQIAAMGETPPWLWLLLVVGVDAGHVYSTLFRTYFDKAEMRRRQALYLLAPLALWVAGAVLYSFGALAFWRVLAYLAVFHFVRQQYGFMMLYARGERDFPPAFRRIDQAAIYLATIFPLIYWHGRTRSFSWFVEGDFVTLPLGWIVTAAGAVTVCVFAAYLIKETWAAVRLKRFNLPKNLLLLGTAASWFTGIVVFDNDLAFTATNVIAHGVPYTALIWIYGYKRRRREGDGSYVAGWMAKAFHPAACAVYVLALFGIAWAEEGIWDGLVWREAAHAAFFAPFAAFLPWVKSEAALAWIVPLLSLPQATHYILDAVIWKHNLKDSEWKQILLAP